MIKLVRWLRRQFVYRCQAVLQDNTPSWYGEYHYGIRNHGNIRCERDSSHIGVHCGGDYCWSAWPAVERGEVHARFY